jgi:hypothetical protein
MFRTSPKTHREFSQVAVLKGMEAFAAPKSWLDVVKTQISAHLFFGRSADPTVTAVYDNCLPGDKCSTCTGWEVLTGLLIAVMFLAAGSTHIPCFAPTSRSFR